MARSLILCFIIVHSSSTLKTNVEECHLSSKVTVRWVECRPYIYHAGNSPDSNTTDVKAAGIIPTALEILRNVSNLTFKYEEASDNTGQLKETFSGNNYRNKSNQLIFLCVSMNSKMFNDDDDDEDDHESDANNMCGRGKACPVKVTDSYGPVFMTRYQAIQPIYLILNGLEKIWKAMVVTLLLACLAGIVLWIAERNKNPEEFPSEFISGSWQGFWWALVTMTTVGYGDKAPKSIAGRLVTICWMMIGMVFFSILTGTMTGVLFMTAEPKDATMFGKRVAVLADSEEVQIAMRESAYVVEYNTVADIIQAVRNNDVSFLLLDRFIVNAYLAEFSRYDFRVTKLIDNGCSYFVFVMSSVEDFSKNLAACFKSQMYVVGAATQKIKMEMSNEWSQTKGVEPENIIHNGIIITLSGILAFLVCLGVTWQYYHSKNAVDDKGTKEINQEVKMEDLDSAYDNIMKKENFTKCLSCRQCKRCNAQI